MQPPEPRNRFGKPKPNPTKPLCYIIFLSFQREINKGKSVVSGCRSGRRWRVVARRLPSAALVKPLNCSAVAAVAVVTCCFHQIGRKKLKKKFGLRCAAPLCVGGVLSGLVFLDFLICHGRGVGSKIEVIELLHLVVVESQCRIYIV